MYALLKSGLQVTSYTSSPVTNTIYLSCIFSVSVLHQDALGTGSFSLFREMKKDDHAQDP
jgi:hypothetical protein